MHGGRDVRRSSVDQIEGRDGISQRLTCVRCLEPRRSAVECVDVVRLCDSAFCGMNLLPAWEQQELARS